jgi:hypothetical protein
MYKINDRVRVIPPGYIDVAKGGLLYRDAWNAVNLKKDDRVMLGGSYKILSQVKSNDTTWVTLIENQENQMGTVPERFLVREEDFDKCPYKVGDKVKFSASCNDSDKEYLLAFNKPFADPNHIYEIKGVLNEYYIFIDCEINDDYAYPFRWVDFKKV